MARKQRPTGPEIEEDLPLVSAAVGDRLLGDILRGVSRTVYLSLRVLPKDLRVPVGLAYLLARAADTISDTRLLAPDQRLKYLLAFRAQVQGPANVKVLRELATMVTDKQALPYERSLLGLLPEAFSMLEALDGSDRSRVRSVMVTLTQGMEMDLTTFPPEGSGRISALKDLSQLDRYIYYVAGCVGEFWTEITMAHTEPLRHWSGERMSEIGVRFGKALQMTNVLRDMSKDLRIGRCYLPEAELGRAGVTPEDLLDSTAGPRARPVLVAGIETALAHYRAAEEYLRAIPRRCFRLRLAALWPVLIGLATLAKVASNEHWLDPDKPSKVSRKWVYRTLLLSFPCVLSNSLLSAWIGRLRRNVEKAL